MPAPRPSQRPAIPAKTLRVEVVTGHRTTQGDGSPFANRRPWSVTNKRTGIVVARFFTESDAKDEKRAIDARWQHMEPAWDSALFVEYER